MNLTRGQPPVAAREPLASAPVNGGVSFWWSELGGPPAAAQRRPALSGRIHADVCIVGGGYTGLWTAYYLAIAAPELQIVVLESQFCGFGASGRNGGWVSALLPGPARRYGAGVDALHGAMKASIAEIARVTSAEGIDADLVQGGRLSVARTPAQLQRLRADVAQHREAPGGDRDTVLLDGSELAARVRVSGALGGSWSPHCARIQPARLVRGLAEAVQRAGVRIYESSRAESVGPGRVVTADGAVSARWIVRATEGYTAALPGQRRTWLPMNSSMIVTDPLPASAWDEIGWAGNETLGDEAHAYCYAQRTADGRIALGGRGVPYRYASHTDADGTGAGLTAASTVSALTALLHSMFPATGSAPISHTWSGFLGVPRDWCATVGLDRESGLGWAGGYVGDGVTTSNLAGRTLTDLILGRDTELTALPWVGRHPRRWEPEPLRFLGVHGLYRAYRLADTREGQAAGEPAGAAGRTSRIARIADVIAGRI
ncbi:MAG TPA: FAD-dependent oxidoreductase [Frankiaceae bacterium]|jgi:glycine/D-amino acid oxidase-like deaminating enzyme|nr:FAD-dependent oxidoreductase [Frankiaceae bacterium]